MKGTVFWIRRLSVCRSQILLGPFFNNLSHLYFLYEYQIKVNTSSQKKCLWYLFWLCYLKTLWTISSLACFFFQKTHGQINDFIASITVIDSIRGTVKGKQQRVLKGPRGVTMLLGILATQSLRYTGMLCQSPYWINESQLKIMW